MFLRLVFLFTLVSFFLVTDGPLHREIGCTDDPCYVLRVFPLQVTAPSLDNNVFHSPHFLHCFGCPQKNGQGPGCRAGEGGADDETGSDGREYWNGPP